jgi:hypothetical protein
LIEQDVIDVTEDGLLLKSAFAIGPLAVRQAPPLIFGSGGSNIVAVTQCVCFKNAL